MRSKHRNTVLFIQVITDPVSAADMITARYDYSFSMGSLLVMIVVIVGYFVMMIKFSETEYKQVISEKFGEK
mgnify:CR=1 FL=1